MKYILSNANVFICDQFVKTNVFVENGRISEISSRPFSPKDSGSIFDLSGQYLFPGFIDVHVHLREPGFFYKESIKSGTDSAAKGGYIAVCPMPNLNPVPDCAENLAAQLDAIRQNACIQVVPYGAVTIGENGQELAAYEEIASDVCGFSDDGRGVQSDEKMRQAMQKISKTGKILAAHCEDNSLLNGGYIHAGEYAARHGHKGICSESEWKQIERDLKLAEETGCKYHVCHISTKESVALIRQAKAKGLDVTCETAPHYLTMNDSMLQEDGRFKMNPPIRSREDRAALIEGLRDGTIDMIATDHAPHSAGEKSRGLEKSAMGVVGLETAFAAVYTHLVKPGILSMDRLMALLNGNAAKRFGYGTPLAAGQPADLTVFDLDRKFTVDPERFQTMGRATPFAGMELYGVCLLTMADGRIVWREDGV